ncbi:hypothetical protein BJV74DRAFT_857033 [Russula compacta]|nr:hypothetical protein BJV74DRAFT_857033 [Russula compacta]
MSSGWTLLPSLSLSLVRYVGLQHLIVPQTQTNDRFWRAERSSDIFDNQLGLTDASFPACSVVSFKLTGNIYPARHNMNMKWN